MSQEYKPIFREPVDSYLKIMYYNTRQVVKNLPTENAIKEFILKNIDSSNIFDSWDIESVQFRQLLMKAIHSMYCEYIRVCFDSLAHDTVFMNEWISNQEIDNSHVNRDLIKNILSKVKDVLA